MSMPDDFLSPDPSNPADPDDFTPYDLIFLTPTPTPTARNDFLGAGPGDESVRPAATSISDDQTVPRLTFLNEFGAH